jgi:hypothetical protein
MKAGYFISAAALFTLAAAASSLGDDGGRGCSNASLYGRYGLATHGERIGVYDASGVIHLYTYNGNPAPVRVDQVTNETFDGHRRDRHLPVRRLPARPARGRPVPGG